MYSAKTGRLRILDPLRLVIFFVTLLFVEQKWSLVGALRKLVFLLAILCFVVLAVTGFVPQGGFWQCDIGLVADDSRDGCAGFCGLRSSSGGAVGGQESVG